MQENNTEKSYYNMWCKFYNEFQRNILPKLKEFEKERKKSLRVLLNPFVMLPVILPLCVASGIFVLIVYGLCTTKSDFSMWILPPFIIFMTFLGVSESLPETPLSQKKEYENKIKANIMPDICSCFGNLRWYSRFNFKKRDFCRLGSALKTIETSCLIPKFNYNTTLADFDDMFDGVYRHVSFEIIETRMTGCFMGAIIVFKMNKNFKGHTVIHPYNTHHLFLGKDLKHTMLEDVNFEKKFKVFTNDEIEARYLITPSFMERLTKLKTAFNSDKISCSFYEDYFYIALSSKKDLFSLGNFFKPVDNPELYYKMYNEIISIYKMIDHFKLNENTGL